MQQNLQAVSDAKYTANTELSGGIALGDSRVPLVRTQQRLQEGAALGVVHQLVHLRGGCAAMHSLRQALQQLGLRGRLSGSSLRKARRSCQRPSSRGFLKAARGPSGQGTVSKSSARGPQQQDGKLQCSACCK